MHQAAIRVLLALTMFGALACGSGSGIMQGKAPDFTLQRIDGSSFTLSKETKGKAVLINFWATWCPPCRSEIPAIINVYNDYKDKGFVVVGVSVDRDGPETVAAFVRDNGIPYPVVMGDDETARAYGGISGIPATFLVDRKGKVVLKFVGSRDEAFFRQEIDKLFQ